MAENAVRSEFHRPDEFPRGPLRRHGCGVRRIFDRPRTVWSARAGILGARHVLAPTAKYWHWAAASGQRDAARGDISTHARDSARSRVFRRILGICRGARGWGSALARRLPTERNLRRWRGGPVERRSTTNGAGRLIGGATPELPRGKDMTKVLAMSKSRR